MSSGQASPDALQSVVGAVKLGALVLAGDGSGGGGVCSVAVNLHELGDIELRCLEGFHLADEDVLEGVNRLASLLDLGADGVRDELADKVLEVNGRSLLGHDVSHALADSLDLSSLGVGGLLELVLPLLGEGKAEHSQLVSIGGGHVNLALDGGLSTNTQTVSLK